MANVSQGDRIHHQISNIETQVTENNVTTTADVTANHYLDNMFWQIAGSYELFCEYYDPIVFEYAFDLDRDRTSKGLAK